MNKELLVIAGPTAIGKTDLSVMLARETGTEVISADSRQIYREMTIGTAVPSTEQLQSVKHHFIHHKSIADYYNAGMYETEVLALVNELFQKYDQVIMTGGSGLYIDAVRFGIDDFPAADHELRESLHRKLEKEGLASLRNDLRLLDPDTYQRIDLKNHKRILKALEISLLTGKPYSSFLTAQKKERNFRIRMLALDMERNELYDRINRRVFQMLEQGLEKEAEELYEYRQFNALNTVGYREMFDWFEGKISREEAVRRIQANTRKYARKQLTWFRKDPGIKWFHPSRIHEIRKFVSGDR